MFKIKIYLYIFHNKKGLYKENKKCFFFIVFLASFETWKLKSKKHFHVFMFLWVISVLCCFFQTHTHKYIHTYHHKLTKSQPNGSESFAGMKGSG